MNAIIIIGMGFCAGLLVMTVLNLYKHVLKLLNRE